jgi:hypothetical protein
MSIKSMIARVIFCAGLLGLTGAARAAPLMFVYKGAGCTGLQQVPKFEAFVGRKVDGVIDFIPLHTWNEMLGFTNWSLGCWGQTKYRVAYGVPMLTSDSSTTLAQGAAGAYDNHFRDLGKLLVSNGRPDAYLRIGWEFNGDWYPWAASKDPAAFRAYFRHIVMALRSVPGARFTIVWNPSAGSAKVAPDAAYPGDDVVDMIGLDIYNASWNPLDFVDAQVRWQDRLTEAYGLDWAAEFARRHGKRLAVPEWGTGARPDGHGLGDDPQFIHNMADWMAHNRVVFEGYWDYPASDYNAELSNGQYPMAAQAFKAAFAPKSP